MTTLATLLSSIESYDIDGVVYAEQSWSPLSAAVCVLEPTGVRSAAPTLEYLLEVELVLDVRAVWSAWRRGKIPTDLELTEAVIHHARFDAHLPVDDV